MSVAYSKLITKKGNEMLVCVFCETVYSEGTVVCSECNDYKGMMTVSEAVKTYDFLEYLAE